MKNIVVPILGAVSIVSTGAVAWLLATPASVDPRATKLEADLKEARQTITSLKAELARKATAPAVVASAPATSVADPTPGDTAPSSPGDQGDLRKMFSNPAMRAVLEQQQAAQVEVGYGRLFEHLQLTSEEREHFKKLLTGRQQLQTDLGLQLMDPNLTPEKRQELMTEAKNQLAVYDATIKKFLNDDNDYKTYRQWEDTQPERVQFDTIGRSLFASSSEPLSQPQEQQLINLMAEVRKSPNSIGGLNDQTGTDPTKLTDEMIAQQMQQIESNARIVSERAETFLSPGQQQTLKKYLEQMKTVSKSGIEMTKMILKSGSK